VTGDDGKTNDLRLKRRLDLLYRDFDFEARVRHDPIAFPRRYRRADDREAAAFIAAALAYGRVSQFMPVVGAILDRMGPSPAAFLRSFRLREARRRMQGLRYRFSGTDDLVALLWALSRAFRRFGGLKGLFLEADRPAEKTLRGCLGGVSRYFLSLDTRPVYGRNLRPRGYRHHFPSPETGGAAKRAALFLRWMVRTRDIDLGLWPELGADRLVIPLDTHIARIARCLGLTRRAGVGWAAAEEITQRFRVFDPADPLRYDFALCHQGISGLCPPRPSAGGCASCRLVDPSFP